MQSNIQILNHFGLQQGLSEVVGQLKKKERGKLLHDVAFPDHATHLTFSGHQLATKCKYTTDLE